MAWVAVPRALADLLKADVLTPQHYPPTQDSHGQTTTESIALWLIGRGWPGGVGVEGDATRVTVGRLLFFRWTHECDFLERGGRLP